MDPVTALFFLVIIGGVGLAAGITFGRSGHHLTPDLDRFVPKDPQTAIKLVAIAIGAVLGLSLLSSLMENGSEDLFPFLFITYWLLIPTLVYLDARERGSHSRARAWAFLTLFTNVLGLAGYLITRPEKPRSCPRCQTRFHEGFTVCPYCGPQAGLNCVSCQSALEPDWRYCPFCQTAVTPEDSFSRSEPSPGETYPPSPPARPHI